MSDTGDKDTGKGTGGGGAFDPNKLSLKPPKPAGEEGGGAFFSGEKPKSWPEVVGKRVLCRSSSLSHSSLLCRPIICIPPSSMSFLCLPAFHLSLAPFLLLFYNITLKHSLTHAYTISTGKTGEEAKAHIDADVPGLKTIILPHNSMTTRDYRLDRVWIFVDEENKVVRPPSQG